MRKWLFVASLLAFNVLAVLRSSSSTRTLLSSLGKHLSYIKDLHPFNTARVLFGKSVAIYIPPPRNVSCEFPIGMLSAAHYTERRQIIRESWGRNQCIYFLTALVPDSKLNNNTNRADKTYNWPGDVDQGDVIVLNLTEMYYGKDTILPQKTLLWFVMARKLFPSAPYVLKTDDDSMVHGPNLRATLQESQPDYWGRVWGGVMPVRDNTSQWYVSHEEFNGTVYPNYCSGAGYVLSQKAVACMAKHAANSTFMSQEDVGTAIILQKCNITQPVSSNHVHAMKWESKHSIATGDSSWIVRHYIKFERPRPVPVVQQTVNGSNLNTTEMTNESNKANWNATDAEAQEITNESNWNTTQAVVHKMMNESIKTNWNRNTTQAAAHNKMINEPDRNTSFYVTSKVGRY